MRAKQAVFLPCGQLILSLLFWFGVRTAAFNPAEFRALIVSREDNNLNAEFEKTFSTVLTQSVLLFFSFYCLSVCCFSSFCTVTLTSPKR